MARKKRKTPVPRESNQDRPGEEEVLGPQTPMPDELPEPPAPVGLPPDLEAAADVDRIGLDDENDEEQWPTGPKGPEERELPPHSHERRWGNI